MSNYGDSATATTVRVMKQVSSQDIDVVAAGEAHYRKITSENVELRAELKRLKALLQMYREAEFGKEIK